MSEIIQLIGSMTSLAAAVWIWRLSNVASLFRYLAVAVAVVIGGTIAGVLSVQFHFDRIIEIVQMLIDLVTGPLSGLLGGIS